MESATTDSRAMHRLQDVPGRGKGLVATRKIPKGTRILSEEPIITASESMPDCAELRASISQQVNALSKRKRKAFLVMHNLHTYTDLAERYLGIFRTNALPMNPDAGEVGIVLQACRINHACDNNAQNAWNDNIKCHTVHALRDIEEGEEITIYYLGQHRNRQYRQDALREKFGFTCTCNLCSLPPDKSLESDARLDKIHQLDHLLGTLGVVGIKSNPVQMLRMVDDQVRLYNEQGPDDAGLPRAYLDAAQIAIGNGDLARGRVFAQRAVAGWKVSGGSDGTAVTKFGPLVQNPAKHQLFGLSSAWSTAANDVPEGLEPRVFEDWLWRRKPITAQESSSSSSSSQDLKNRQQSRAAKKPHGNQKFPPLPARPANLRNRAAFLGFVDLPGETVIDLDFDELGDTGPGYKPRRHWCFLAEITGTLQLHHLELALMDVNGDSVSLHFYTDQRGGEMARTQVREGYTVAVLYARHHVFQHDGPGIRHEDPRMMKIFPASLKALLALSDQLQQFSKEASGLRTCHACSKKAAAAEMHCCGRCLCFWYCDKECQLVGWKDKGHKNHCKLLQDPDLRGLFGLDWDGFDGEVRFPLRTAED